MAGGQTGPGSGSYASGEKESFRSGTKLRIMAVDPGEKMMKR